MKKYSKGILIPIGIAIFAQLIGAIDGGAECGAYPHTETATVTVTVTLEDGNTYTVSENDTEVTVNTFGSDDPRNWEITGY